MVACPRGRRRLAPADLGILILQSERRCQAYCRIVRCFLCNLWCAGAALRRPCIVCYSATVSPHRRMVVWKHALNPDEQRFAMINRGDCRVEYCVENFRAKHIHRVTAQNPDFSKTLRLASLNTSAWHRQRRRAFTASTLGCNFFFSYLRKCDILKAPIINNIGGQ